MANPYKEEFKYCTKCGSRIKKDSRFCIECGTQFFIGLENERTENLKQKRGNKLNLSNKKKILILIFALVIGIGQFTFIFLVQSKDIWQFSNTFAGPESGHLTINVPPNPFNGNKYVMKASESFYYIGSFEFGSVTFTHVDSNQIFYFEYYLGPGLFVGTLSEETTWILPSGEYNVLWYNSDNSPSYKLIAASFFWPYDEIVFMVSGFSALFCVIGVIIQIKRIRKNSE